MSAAEITDPYDITARSNNLGRRRRIREARLACSRS